ncbi:sensor histidine kinase [Salinibacter grassmerensis]|uniref:sensor histidine kinase n=1 Tax=Salinibacter grassmerensis TaxID=3040353 RepID=UPI0021E79DE6|nr:histidine kinase dimerization/phosphoacceptor domain -containing protein [Salinibacter grassmerensis]
MSFRRKILLVVFGLAVGAVVTGGVAGLTLWYVQVGAAPFLADAPELNALLRRSLWLVGGVTGVLALGAAVAGRWLLASFRQSLQVLRDAVEQVRTGRLDAQVSVDPDDELRRLAQALNRMTTTLSQQTVSRDYLQAVLDSMAELLFVVDPDGRIRRVNAAAAEALGRSASALRGTALDDHFNTDPLTSSAEGAVERILAPTNGPERPVLVSRSALERTDATQGTLVCVAQDISERKATEEKLRRSLEEKEVLLREIHHRVKNNLQVISSLLNAQARDVEISSVEDRFAETQDRIRSMASIHEQLYQSGDLARVEFDAYLEGLLDDLFRSHRTDHIDRTLEADAQPLSVDQAIPAGLIVNELVTNALEHAFPTGQSGTVAVTFYADEGTARLAVADDGRGTDGLDENGSLGLRLVRGLTRQLRGTLSTDLDDGVTVTITFPTNPSS